MKGLECPFSTKWEYQQKMAICKPGRVFSPDIYSAGTLILNFPASGINVWYLSHSVYGICYGSQNWLRQKSWRLSMGEDRKHGIIGM